MNTDIKEIITHNELAIYYIGLGISDTQLQEKLDYYCQSEFEKPLSEIQKGRGIYVVSDNYKVESDYSLFRAITIISRVVRIQNEKSIISIKGHESENISYCKIITTGQYAKSIRFDLNNTSYQDVKVDNRACTLIEEGIISNELEQAFTTESTDIIESFRAPLFIQGMRLIYEKSTELVQNQPEKDQAISMLTWVVSCSTIAVKENLEFRDEYFDLIKYSNSILLNTCTDKSIMPVPNVSMEVQKKQISSMLSLCENYDTKIEYIDKNINIDTQSQEFSQIFYENNEDEIDVVSESINQLDLEITAQISTYEKLDREFQNLVSESNRYNESLLHEIAVKKIIGDFTMVINCFKSIIELSASAAVVAYYPQAIGPVNAAFGRAEKAVTQLLESGMTDSGALIKNAKALNNTQINIADQLNLVRELNSESGTDLSEKYKTFNWNEIAAIDPITEWDQFMDLAESSLAPLVNENFEYALKYLATLKNTARFAKAINAKSIAIAKLNMSMQNLDSQRRGLISISSRWGSAINKVENKIAVSSILRGMIEADYMNLRRQLISKYIQYRNLYFYNWMSLPNEIITIDMDTISLRQSFLKVEDQLARMLSTIQPGQEYDTGLIQVDMDSLDSNGVRYRPEEKVIEFSINIVNSLLDEYLPDRPIIVFIQEANFFVNSDQPISETKITKLEISTSGYYQNGKNSVTTANFVGNQRSLDFHYSEDISGLRKIITPWRPAKLVEDDYLLPTPFTQWSIKIKDSNELSTLTSLSLRFKGYYVNNIL